MKERCSDSGPESSEEKRTIRTALAGALVFLCACQSYEPSPLLPAEHRAAWHGRTLQDASLEAYLERVNRVNPDPSAPGSEAFDPGDGLSLREGRIVALVFNPNVRIARLGVGRAVASAENAGLWDDPQFTLDVMRITDNVPDRWVITSGLAFTIPLSNRLSVERDLADAGLRAAERRALEAEWDVLYAVDQAWIEWSAAGQRIEETTRLVAAMDGLVQATSTLAESGELRSTEASLFAVERAQRRNQLRRLRGEEAAAEQRLRSLLGLPPGARVEFVPLLRGADDVPRAATDLDGLGAHNPTLARLREEYLVAEESLQLEIKRQIPDLTLGPLGETDQGQSRIGFLGGFPIPILNANRRAIAEARVDREIARAAFETRYETLVGRHAAAEARAEALAAQRDDMQRTLVPLVDRQLSDSMRLMSLGEGSTLVLLASLGRAYETKIDFIGARQDEALARAELAYLNGPPEAPTSEVNPPLDPALDPDVPPAGSPPQETP